MFEKQYLKLISFVTLFLMQIFGIFPFYYNSKRMAFETNPICSIYPFLVVTFIIVGYTISILTITEIMIVDIIPLGQLAVQTVFYSINLCLITIYVVNYVQKAFLNKSISFILKTLTKLWKITNNIEYNQEFHMFSVNSLLATGLNVAVECFQVYCILPSIADSWWITILHILPFYVITLFPDFFHSILLIIHYGHRRINQEIESIMDEVELLNSTNTKTGNKTNYFQMKKYCELSDRLDDLSVAHYHLMKVTNMFCQSTSIQLLLWMIFVVINFIMKAFMLYLSIISTINKTYYVSAQFILLTVLQSICALLHVSTLARTSYHTTEEVGTLCCFTWRNVYQVSRQ